MTSHKEWKRIMETEPEACAYWYLQSRALNHRKCEKCICFKVCRGQVKEAQQGKLEGLIWLDGGCWCGNCIDARIVRKNLTEQNERGYDNRVPPPLLHESDWYLQQKYGKTIIASRIPKAVKKREKAGFDKIDLDKVYDLVKQKRIKEALK